MTKNQLHSDPGPMSALGHKWKWSPAISESGLPSGTDIQHSAYDFGFVPNPEVILIGRLAW
jgi:hypothetical protein